MNESIVTPASLAVDALAASLNSADAAALKSLASHYGKGIERGAVTLALAAARVAQGDKLPRTGAAQRIKATLAMIDPATATDADYVSAAASVRAQANADKRAADQARKDERAAVKAVENDRSASIPDRLTAAAARMQMDEIGTVAKKRAAIARVESAVASAVALGFTYDDMLGLLFRTFPDVAVEADAA